MVTVTVGCTVRFVEGGEGGLSPTVQPQRGKGKVTRDGAGQRLQDAGWRRTVLGYILARPFSSFRISGKSLKWPKPQFPVKRAIMLVDHLAKC